MQLFEKQDDIKKDGIGDYVYDERTQHLWNFLIIPVYYS